MAFKFRFQKLLRIKELREQKLMKEYSELIMQYQALMQELVELKTSRDDSIIKRKEMERTGSLAASFDAIELFLDGNKRQCIEKIGEIKACRAEADNKKVEMLEASKEKKIFEKLKEIKAHEYLVSKAAEDDNELDEVNGQYFGRSF
jgi:flagellar FliJ protein